jgi:nitrite reductase/ring-hydroxylating ferredoxin subunit
MNPQQPSTVLQPGDYVCASNQLLEGGCGVRFLVDHNGHSGPAFVVRHAGRTVAYLNRCAHRLVELDWQEGDFFDTERRHLVCATHGALYDPASGVCVSGPCLGAALTAVPVREMNGAVWLAQSPVTTSNLPL